MSELPTFGLDADSRAELAKPLASLLDDVDAVFVELGGHTMLWEDPHQLPGGGRQDIAEEEYSRILDPEKYRILWIRAEAWSQVLVERGWASQEPANSKQQEPWFGTQNYVMEKRTVLRPVIAGALPLQLAYCRTEDGELPLLWVGGAEPAVNAHAPPACGCDACDDGSAQLLEGLDEAILAVVEGALEIIWDGSELQRRLVSTGSRGDGGELSAAPFRLNAGPWAVGWEPRQLINLN